MPQVVGYPGSGLKLSKGVSIFTGAGDPNSSATRDVQQAQIGSLYLRVDAPDSTHCLYICTTSALRQTATQNATVSAWTAK